MGNHCLCKVLHLCAPEILSHITFALGHVAESLSDIALDERFADDHLGGEVRKFTFLACFHLLRIGSKFRCIRSTPTERQSTSENDFECFASTGVNTPETMSPSL